MAGMRGEAAFRDLSAPPALTGKRLFSPLPHGYSGSSRSQCGLIRGVGWRLKTRKQQGDLLWPRGSTISFT